MATNARPRKAPIAPAPSNERDPNSRPFFTQKVKLQSLHAQQVFDRGVEIVGIPELRPVEQQVRPLL